MSNPVEILYIIGAGHCGSTLLNLCLDRHSSVIGVSEIITLNNKKTDWSGDDFLLKNTFWSAVDRLMTKKYGYRITEVPFRLNSKLKNEDVASQCNKAALETILKISEKRIIADSSKNSKRLSALLGNPLFKVRVIYLVRDGRGIVHSYRRKYKNWWTGWYKLLQTDHAVRSLMNIYGADNWMTIRYEDMVTDLEKTMQKICKFAGISFESSMLHPDTSDFNGIAGNRIVTRPIDSIKLDTAWKTEMSTIMRTFTTLAVNSFNTRYGYRK